MEYQLVYLAKTITKCQSTKALHVAMIDAAPVVLDVVGVLLASPSRFHDEWSAAAGLYRH